MDMETLQGLLQTILDTSQGVPTDVGSEARVAFEVIQEKAREALNGVDDVRHTDNKLCFKEGATTATICWPDKPWKCPYQEGTEAEHWWTLGFSYEFRIFRALEAERRVVLLEDKFDLF